MHLQVGSIFQPAMAMLAGVYFDLLSSSHVKQPFLQAIHFKHHISPSQGIQLHISESCQKDSQGNSSCVRNIGDDSYLLSKRNHHEIINVALYLDAYGKLWIVH